MVEVRRGDLGHGASAGPAAAIHWQLDSFTVLLSLVSRGDLQALQHPGINLGARTSLSKQGEDGQTAPGQLL